MFIVFKRCLNVSGTTLVASYITAMTTFFFVRAPSAFAFFEKTSGTYVLKSTEFRGDKFFSSDIFPFQTREECERVKIELRSRRRQETAAAERSMISSECLESSTKGR
jgi:hypothetical protein